MYKDHIVNNILYHITKKKYISSILIKGLIPAYRKGIKVCGDRCKYVYLTNNINKIIYEQCGINYCKKHDLIIIEINCENLIINPKKYISNGTYTISTFEFITNKITPDRILKISDLKLEELSL